MRASSLRGPKGISQSPYPVIVAERHLGKDIPLRIEAFLNSMGSVYKGRIPLICETLEGLKSRWASLQDALWRRVPETSSVRAFVREMCTALRGLKERSLRYEDLSTLVQLYEACKGEFDEGLDEALGRCVLALHDVYVIRRNDEAGAYGAVPSDQTEETCRQCGECCIGPAEGPISTSPTDLSVWEILGRDDLLYYTLPGSCEVSQRASSLAFYACPFLRYIEPNLGLCLVHPVKPSVCTDYSCTASSAGPRGKGLGE